MGFTVVSGFVPTKTLVFVDEDTWNNIVNHKQRYLLIDELGVSEGIHIELRKHGDNSAYASIYVSHVATSEEKDKALKNRYTIASIGSVSVMVMYEE